MARNRKSPPSIADIGSSSPKRAGRICGLCGKSGRLTRTDCCHNWICDDEASYRPFSYARNSCARNHGRYTLCAFHFNEGHKGSWQACSQCRESFVPEMYVYYGTNEYNFSVLPDPPAFEPTLCGTCGKRIVLGESGFSMFKGTYFCETCTSRESPRSRSPRRGARRSR